MPDNVVGPQIRKLRFQKGLTQNELAARCCVAGFDISRGTLAKIEAQVRCVNDSELYVLAKVLGVSIDKLYGNQSPPVNKSQLN